MKYTVACIALFCAIFTTRVNAQSVPVVGKLPKVHAGLVLGANFEQLSGNNWEQAYKPGVVFGAFGELTKNGWGLSVAALFNTSQYNLTDSATAGTFRAFYLNVPVLVEYRVIPRVWLQLGPQFGDLLSIKSGNSTLNDPKSYFNTSNVSGVVGVEARLPLHMLVGARYVLGFTDLRKESIGSATDAWKTRTIQAYVGFRFI